MGCVVVLLLAILCTLIFGPAPILVVGVLAVAYALLMFVGAVFVAVGAMAKRSIRGERRAALRAKPARPASHFAALPSGERRFYRWTGLAIFAAAALAMWALR
jgi:hypothetical protein